MPDDQSLNEIVNLRSERNKTFDIGNGKKRLVSHCRPIHYLKDGKFEDIVLDFQDDGQGNFVSNKNKISTGFRQDLQLYKYFGLRYDYEHQFEGTIKEIKLDGIEQVVGSTVASLQKESKNKIKHQLNSEIEIVNELNWVSLKNFIKVNNPIEDFKIVEELHLKGLTCSNEKKDNEYVVDKYNRFNFVDEKGELKFWINKPFFREIEGNQHDNLIHTLQEIDGHLIYTKTPTREGQDDLVLANYPIYIDSNTYYSSSADGYVIYTGGADWDTIRHATDGTAANNTSESSPTSLEVVGGGKTNDISRSFFYFNTSDIGSGSTVTSAILSLYSTYIRDKLICVQKGTQADILTTADLDSFTGDYYGNVSFGTSLEYKSITFNAQGCSDIVKDGTTKLCARNYSYDYLDSPPDSDYYTGCYFSEDTSGTKDPRLTIEYTSGGTTSTSSTQSTSTSSTTTSSSTSTTRSTSTSTTVSTSTSSTTTSISTSTTRSTSTSSTTTSSSTSTTKSTSTSSTTTSSSTTKSTSTSTTVSTSTSLTTTSRSTSTSTTTTTLPCADGWSFYEEIVSDHTKVSTADQTDFPALVVIPATSSVWDYSRTDGYDVIFTDTTGGIKLTFEREQWDKANLIGIFWVKIPTLYDASATTIRMYYGKSTQETDLQDANNVWDANYKGVWHLGTSPVSFLPDSTVTPADLTANGSMEAADLIDAQVGKGLIFESAKSQWLQDIDATSKLDITGNYTLSQWVYLDNFTTNYFFLAHGDGDAYWQWTLYTLTGASAGKITFTSSAGGNITSTTALGTSVWAYVVATRSGTTGSLYINAGTPVTGTGFNNPNSRAEGVMFGHNHWTPGLTYIPGRADELRISNIARTTSWIITEYNNQYSPSTFWTFGSIQLCDGATTTSTSSSTSTSSTTTSSSTTLSTSTTTSSSTTTTLLETTSTSTTQSTSTSSTTTSLSTSTTKSTSTSSTTTSSSTSTTRSTSTSSTTTSSSTSTTKSTSTSSTTTSKSTSTTKSTSTSSTTTSKSTSTSVSTSTSSTTTSSSTSTTKSTSTSSTTTSSSTSITKSTSTSSTTTSSSTSTTRSTSTSSSLSTSTTKSTSTSSTTTSSSTSTSKSTSTSSTTTSSSTSTTKSTSTSSTTTSSSISTTQSTSTSSTTTSSSTSTSISTSTTTTLPPDKDYSHGDEAVLPSDDTDLEHAFTSQDYADVSADDTVRVVEEAFVLYGLFLFKDKNTNNTDGITVVWNGQSNVAPSLFPVTLQIFNRISGLWETLDTDNSSNADTDFDLNGSQTTNLSNYYDINDWISCRVYQ